MSVPSPGLNLSVSTNSTQKWLVAGLVIVILVLIGIMIYNIVTAKNCDSPDTAANLASAQRAAAIQRAGRAEQATRSERAARAELLNHAQMSGGSQKNSAALAQQRAYAEHAARLNDDLREGRFGREGFELPKVKVDNAELRAALDDPDVTTAAWTPNIACPDGICAGLGEGFDLRKLNTLNDPKVLLNGRSIFTDTKVGSCAEFSSGGRNGRNLETVSDTKDLVSKVSSSLNIDGTFPIQTATAKASISANTGYDATSHSDIKTSYLDLVVESGNVYFKNNDKCRGVVNLNEAFLSDFRRLPAAITFPKEAGSWSVFEAFFNKWGTHILNQIAYGSRLQQWESTVGSSSDIDKTLQVKACLNVEGANKSFAANACAGFNSDDRAKASRVQTNSNSVIIGGSDDTRRDLQMSITPQSIEAFLRSSAESNQGIAMQFTPIWRLLSLYFTGTCNQTAPSECQDLQRAINLEAAYAFSALKCDYLSSNGYVYQEFRKNSPVGGIITYNCFSKKTGCTTNDDCHYSGSKAGCQAGGPSAFDTGAVFGDPNEHQYRTKVRGDTEGGINDGINNSCYYKFLSGCKCDGGWAGGLPDRYLWNQGLN